MLFSSALSSLSFNRGELGVSALKTIYTLLEKKKNPKKLIFCKTMLLGKRELGEHYLKFCNFTVHATENR